ncbi:ATP-binding protein [Actinomadura sp. NPDC047616]|uniref:ATP-binding protein n=1 Tax=Actinomadura sp. NPDC047616 TaxID=3155914 RepID=UPI0033CC59E3
MIASNPLVEWRLPEWWRRAQDIRTRGEYSIPVNATRVFGERRFPQDPRSAEAARGWIVSRIKETIRFPEPAHIDTEVIDDIVLCADEVIANSVVHADQQPGDSIRVLLAYTWCTVRVEVTDPGSGNGRAPRVRNVDLWDETGGRGLIIVQNLSHDWGSDQNATGRTTWFEVEY